MLEIIFCLFMLSQCAYLTLITKQLDEVLKNIQEALKGVQDDA